MSSQTPRQPRLVGAKVADNVIFRIYDPPRPLGGTPGDWAVAATFRDFKIASVDFGADGTMVLHSVLKIGEMPDLSAGAEFGAKIEEWSHLISAVIDSDGHLRAESIVTPESPDGRVN